MLVNVLSLVTVANYPAMIAMQCGAAEMDGCGKGIWHAS